MNSVGCRSIWSMRVWVCVVCVVCAVCAACAVSAQVTFSRDWSGGKRAPPAAAVFDCSQFARLCRQFIHELKEAMSSEKFEKHRRSEPDDSALAYDDK